MICSLKIYYIVFVRLRSVVFVNVVSDMHPGNHLGTVHLSRIGILNSCKQNTLAKKSCNIVSSSRVRWLDVFYTSRYQNHGFLKADFRLGPFLICAFRCFTRPRDLNVEEKEEIVQYDIKAMRYFSNVLSRWISFLPSLYWNHNTSPPAGFSHINSEHWRVKCSLLSCVAPGPPL